MAFLVRFAVMFSCICASFGDRKRFDGYQLLSFDLKTAEDLENVELLHRYAKDIDWWRGPGLGQNNAVLVAPEELTGVKIIARSLRLQFKVERDDIESVVARQYEEMREARGVYKRAQGGDVVDHANFHNLTTYMDYLDQLQAEYPDLMDIETLGNETYEKNKMKVVKLHAPITKNKNKKSSKKVIMVEAGIHCREWATQSSALYVIEKMLQGFRNQDLKFELMLRLYDWWIVPIANPDGYAFTHDEENGYRMWRKNMRPVTLPKADPEEKDRVCFGVDLNRNFDFQFGTTGVDLDCGWMRDTYPGPFGFSEVETQNLRDLALSSGDRLEAYFSTHAFSQLLLKPWAYYRGNDNPHPNDKELDQVGLLMVDAMEEVAGKKYKFGTPYKVLGYAASGGSIDWAIHVWKKAYSYAIEMRPKRGSHGFLLPREDIVPAGKELLAALSTMALKTTYAIRRIEELEDFIG